VSSKLFASVSGVCVVSAVVVGGALAAITHDDAAPAQHPAGNEVSVAPVQTVVETVTASASPTATAVAKVSPSVKQAVPKRQAAVVPQGDPVTQPDPTTAEPAPARSEPAGTDGTINLGTGTTGEDGIRRAPAPSVGIRPAPPVQPPPLGPGAPGAPGDPHGD
jgi:hypothetical protein